MLFIAVWYLVVIVTIFIYDKFLDSFLTSVVTSVTVQTFEFSNFQIFPKYSQRRHRWWFQNKALIKFFRSQRSNWWGNWGFYCRSYLQDLKWSGVSEG